MQITEFSGILLDFIIEAFPDAEIFRCKPHKLPDNLHDAAHIDFPSGLTASVLHCRATATEPETMHISLMVDSYMPPYVPTFSFTIGDTFDLDDLSSAIFVIHEFSQFSTLALIDKRVAKHYRGVKSRKND